VYVSKHQDPPRHGSRDGRRGPGSGAPVRPQDQRIQGSRASKCPGFWRCGRGDRGVVGAASAPPAGQASPSGAYANW